MTLRARENQKMARLVIKINNDAKTFVQLQAVIHGISEADVVLRALEAYRFIESVKILDGDVVFRRSNGDLERLIHF